LVTGRDESGGYLPKFGGRCAHGTQGAITLKVLETERLILRWITTADVAFIHMLMNEPSYLRFIGDKGIETIADAHEYILNGPVDSYENFGYGLYLTELKEDGAPIGICGLVNRESIEDVDIGFAFLPEYWAKGYAHESAEAVIAYGKNVVGLKRIVAVTTADNQSSIRLIEKIGLRFEKMVSLSADESDVKLFSCEF
jgi:RimJ/RimL family protein N-acetyltransferase